LPVRRPRAPWRRRRAPADCTRMLLGWPDPRLWGPNLPPRGRGGSSVVRHRRRWWGPPAAWQVVRHRHLRPDGQRCPRRRLWPTVGLHPWRRRLLPGGRGPVSPVGGRSCALVDFVRASGCRPWPVGLRGCCPGGSGGCGYCPRGLGAWFQSGWCAAMCRWCLGGTVGHGLPVRTRACGIMVVPLAVVVRWRRSCFAPWRQ
jgi:hypothetical protein